MINRVVTAIKSKIGRSSGMFFVLLLVFLGISLLRNVNRIRRASGTISEAEMRVEKLKEEQIELEEKLAQVEAEEYVEKQLRDKLGLAKEGETVIVLPDDETLRKFAPLSQKEEEVLPDPNWKRWVNLFL